MKARAPFTAPRTQITLSFVHNWSPEGERWKKPRLPPSPRVPAREEYPEWWSFAKVIKCSFPSFHLWKSLSGCVSSAGPEFLSLSLIPSVTLLCSISFWGYLLVSLPLAYLFLYMSLSLYTCLYLSESLILPLTDSVSISLFLSASLWSPLCLSFPGHPPLLSLILFLSLPFLPFLFSHVLLFS